MHILKNSFSQVAADHWSFLESWQPISSNNLVRTTYFSSNGSEHDNVNHKRFSNSKIKTYQSVFGAFLCLLSNGHEDLFYPSIYLFSSNTSKIARRYFFFADVERGYQANNITPRLQIRHAYIRTLCWVSERNIGRNSHRRLSRITSIRWKYLINFYWDLRQKILFKSPHM